VTKECDAPAVSVVVPTCGRPELLARCLEALSRQTLDARLFEIIVVDDSRTRHGPAVARNRGWRRARGEIVAFTDDDTEPRPDWLASGLRAFRDDVEAVSGRVLMPVPEVPSDYERDARGLERGEFVTANCFCRRRILEEVGGFDERFRLAWREDSDLQFRLLRAGARIVRAPDAVVIHPVRPAPWGVSIRQQRKVMFDALLYKKHRKLYRERIRATPRWDYYATTASLAAALFSFFTGLEGFFMASALLWTVLTAAFCAKRLRGTSRSWRHVLEMALTSMLIPPLAAFWRLVGSLRFRVAFV
jgi:cellulose synthase/poly-beta-1,6-N-acetylglucosamine synthase-like glycosyltransferase